MSSTSSNDPTAMACSHCELMSTQYPELDDVFYKPLLQYIQQKLWHQLTTLCYDFVSKESNVRSDGSNNNFIDLYEQILIRFENKLHPLSTSRIVIAVVMTMIHMNQNGDHTSHNDMIQVLITKYQERLDIAKSMDHDNNMIHTSSSSYRKKKDNTINLMEAIMYLQSKMNTITLSSMLLSSETTSTTGTTTKPEDTQVLLDIKQRIDKNALILQEWTAANKTTSTSAPVAASATTATDTAIVHAAHYEQSMTYYKLVGPPELFYEQAMQFLTYSPPPSAMTDDSSSIKFGTINYHQLAIDLCLSALTGDGVYNLGQVEQTSCLKLLESTEDVWLVELLQAVSYGKVLEFHELTKKYDAQIQRQPTLIVRSNAIEEKLTLMALIECIVSESNKLATTGTASGTSNNIDRSNMILSLTDIAEALHRPSDQVEYVIMRACSVRLIDAILDQVDNTVEIKWVMPRILNATQMITLAKRFDAWSTQVNTIDMFMKDHTQTLFA